MMRTCDLYTMVQQIAILFIFAVAVGYLLRLAYRSFQAKHACTSGCGKCGAVDFAKIEKQISSGMPPVRKNLR